MMRTQTEVAEKFQELRARSGMSWAEVSKLCGYTYQSAMQRYYTPGMHDKPYLPVKIIDVLLKHFVGLGTPAITAEEVMLMAPLAGFEKDQEFEARSAAPPKAGEGMAAAPYSGAWAGPDKIPVLAYAAASGERNAVNLENDIPIRWIERPHWLVGVVKAAAAQIMGDSMYPRYMDGDLVFINMSMPPVKGKDCVVNTKDGYTHIKQYLGQDKQSARFHQYNPPQDITIHKRDIESMYAIVGRD